MVWPALEACTQQHQWQARSLLLLLLALKELVLKAQMGLLSPRPLLEGRMLRRAFCSLLLPMLRPPKSANSN